VFKNIPVAERFLGKPRTRWLDDAENDRKEMGVTGWIKIARDKDA
jgi:hypothetical protein